MNGYRVQRYVHYVYFDVSHMLENVLSERTVTITREPVILDGDYRRTEVVSQGLLDK